MDDVKPPLMFNEISACFFTLLLDILMLEGPSSLMLVRGGHDTCQNLLHCTDKCTAGGAMYSYYSHRASVVLSLEVCLCRLLGFWLFLFTDRKQIY